VTSRKPDDTESKVLQKLLEKNRAAYKADASAAAALLKIGQSPLAKDVGAAELAAWTAVCRALLNLSETITRE
jgi:hypothetical protein